MLDIRLLDEGDLPAFEVGDRCLVTAPQNRGRISSLIREEFKRCRLLGMTEEEQGRSVSERLVDLCWKGRMRARTDDRILLEQLAGDGVDEFVTTQWFDIDDIFAVLKQGETNG